MIMFLLGLFCAYIGFPFLSMFFSWLTGYFSLWRFFLRFWNLLRSRRLEDVVEKIVLAGDFLPVGLFQPCPYGWRGFWKLKKLPESLHSFFDFYDSNLSVGLFVDSHFDGGDYGLWNDLKVKDYFLDLLAPIERRHGIEVLSLVVLDMSCPENKELVESSFDFDSEDDLLVDFMYLILFGGKAPDFGESESFFAKLRCLSDEGSCEE